MSRCKECVKASVRANRLAKIDYYQEFDRKRADLPHRKLARSKYAKAQAKTATGRKKAQERRRVWLARNRVKRAAHVIAGNAIRDGKLIPEPCARCGAKSTDAHHEDYYKPLDVLWLCRKCHGVRHKEINTERRMQKKPWKS